MNYLVSRLTHDITHVHKLKSNFMIRKFNYILIPCEEQRVTYRLSILPCYSITLSYHYLLIHITSMCNENIESLGRIDNRDHLDFYHIYNSYI
jgi:hypothetical protein